MRSSTGVSSPRQMLCGFSAKSKKGPHGSSRISSKLIPRIAKELGHSHRSHVINPREVIFQNRECQLSGRARQQGLQSLEHIVGSTAVVLQDVDEVVGIFVL